MAIWPSQQLIRRPSIIKNPLLNPQPTKGDSAIFPIPLSILRAHCKYRNNGCSRIEATVAENLREAAHKDCQQGKDATYAIPWDHYADYEWCSYVLIVDKRILHGLRSPSESTYAWIAPQITAI